MPPTPELPKNALPVPLVAQANDYSCGAAALLSVLYYWRAYTGTESSLYPILDTTPEDGTEPDKIAEAARAFGLEGRYQEGMTIVDLRHALAQGETVIVALQAWRDAAGSGKPWRDTWEDGHYAVLVGIDQENAYFMDSAVPSSHAFVPLNELLERWHDYEDRRGRVWRYFNLGIRIKGRNPLRSLPGPLVRMT